MKKEILVLLFAVLMFQSIYGQNESLVPTTKAPAYFDMSPPIREMQLIKPAPKQETAMEISNKIGPKEFNNRVINNFEFPEDQVWQKQDGTYIPDNPVPLQNWEGISNLSNVYPPDTQGDVGLDKYVQVVNSNYAVYSKTGTLLQGPAALSTIWNGIPSPWNGTNSGDPVVLYDQAADRWFISQFSIPNYTQMAILIAVSVTNDPTGAWYRYVYDFGTKLPDYPKFGIWSDGYYMSANLFLNSGGWVWNGISACAFDRTKMLAGDPTAGIIQFELPASADPGPMLPSDWDGTTPPVAGEPNYFTYFDDWSHPTNDYLKMWEFHVNWTTPASSTFTKTDSLQTVAFDSEICAAYRGRCIPQPTTAVKLETLSDRLMFRMQYRNFGTHRSMVTNHSVDVNGAGLSGIRWYELRKTGGAWSIFQQGTYAPDADHRWMGSIAMNQYGDIALGYSVSNGTSLFPSIRYTGRRVNDPLGLMTVAEQTIITGTGAQTGSSARWGDYSMMSVDPVDDKTFWFTTEYVQTTGTVTWKTRIASFLFDDSPSVVTLGAYNITSTSATMEGIINPLGLSTSWNFEHGPTTSLGSASPVQTLPPGPVSVNISQSVTGLVSGTVYYRLKGVNANGTTYGTIKSFTAATTSITTTPATNITTGTAITGGNIVLDGGLAVISRGVCYSTSPNPDINGTKTQNGSGSGIFSANLTNLLPNTLYYIRAYAINSNGPIYGEILYFRTYCTSVSAPVSEQFGSGSIPDCWSQQITPAHNSLWSVSPSSYAGGLPYEMYSSFSSSMSYIGDNRLVMPPLNTVGKTVLYLYFKHYLDTYSNGGVVLKIQSSSDGITWTDESWSVVTNSANIGPENIAATITNNVNSPTTFIAFVISGPLFYFDFWTIDDVNLSSTPYVSTSPVSAVTVNSATISGNVVSEGGKPVTQRGLCYGTTPNPSLAGTFTSNGTGTGSFSSNITGLVANTTYHVRAFATNEHGTVYGQNITFKTQCFPSTLPYAESFSGVVIPDCWSQVDYKGNGQIWKFGVMTPQSPMPVLNGNYAFLDSDDYGAGNSQNADLVSPTIDLTAYGMVSLHFNYFYRSITGQTGSLSYSIDNGSSWTLIQQFTATSGNPATFSQVIPAVAGQSQVKFKWNLTATWGWYWAIDDIQITGIPLVTPVMNINVPYGISTCFQAVQSIIVAGNGTTFHLQNGASADFIAGQKINFYPGTRVFSGGYMHGFIAPNGPFCSAPSPNSLVQTEPETETEIEDAVAAIMSPDGSAVRVYPNPTSGKFFIDLSGSASPEVFGIQLYSSTGERILSREIRDVSKYEVSLENKPAGLYLLNIKWNGRSENVKIIRY